MSFLAGVLSGFVIDLVWLFTLTPVTGVYEIVPGFICSLVIAVLVSKAAGKPSEGALAVYDTAMQEGSEE